MTTYYTADLHLSHANIIRFCDRPFSSIEEHDQALVDNWNDTVGPDDDVFVLGDFAMGTIAESLPLVARLNGFVHLIPGNHDRCWTGHGPQAERWVQKYLDAGFGQIHEPSSVHLGSQVVALAHHFPFAGADPTDNRYEDQRPLDDGTRLLIHGHVHEKWKRKGRMINVGVDQWDYRPVSGATLAAMFQEVA